MPRVAVRPSRFVADLLRRRRQHLGLTLRDVEARARSAGSPIPFSTLARVEQGRVDPGVRRLHVLLKIYDLPIEAAGDLLDLELNAREIPKTKDLKGLKTEAFEAWQAGDSGRALACLAALQERASKEEVGSLRRQDGLLTFAVVASKLGKHHLARLILDRLLMEGPAPEILARILIQEAVCWGALGSPDVALAFLGRAQEILEGHRVRGKQERQQLAWLRHQQGLIHLDQRHFDAANASLGAAIRLYEAADDLHGKGLALLTTARLAFERGSAKEALSASHRAYQHAKKHRFGRLQILAAIEEGRAHGLGADWDRCVAALTDALAAALRTGDNIAQFYAHYYLWKAHARQRNEDLAEVSLNAAKYFVRYVDDRVREAEEIRGLLADTAQRATPRP